MAYRIRFTGEDLTRTRVAGAPGPLLELDLAMRVLRRRNQPMRFGAWRREVSMCLPPSAKTVLDLVSFMNESPTCLLPADPGDPRELLDRKQAGTERLLAQEMEAAVERRGLRLPNWAARICQEPELLRSLYRGVGEVHERVLAPYWRQVTDVVAADRSLRTRALLDGGMERLLSGLSPRHVRWDPPTLSLLVAGGYDGALQLRGRGLLLVPTLFGAEAPVVNPYAEPQPVMTYPASLGDSVEAPALAVTWQSTPATSKSLAQLLGRTRAAVLSVVAERPGITTRELAGRTGVSPASASEHATVLRQAGLITSVRRSNTVLHTLTDAGVSLLNAPNRSRATPARPERLARSGTLAVAEDPVPVPPVRHGRPPSIG